MELGMVGLGRIMARRLRRGNASVAAFDRSFEVSQALADSGEGRWTAIEAVELGVPAPIMSLALMMRFATQNRNDYAAKLLAMMREGFGGHLAPRSGDGP